MPIFRVAATPAMRDIPGYASAFANRRFLNIGSLAPPSVGGWIENIT
jgi:hypothetical protein